MNSLWGGLNLGKRVPWKPDKVNLQRDPASSSVNEGMWLSVDSLRSKSVLLLELLLRIFFSYLLQEAKENRKNIFIWLILVVSPSFHSFILLSSLPPSLHPSILSCLPVCLLLLM